ncbi:MAG: hypothetical protein IJG70_08945 [Kiritimatiellae bacterium]|nr:hypothetical protein [Kiritimatiellia bacterium]
MAASADEPVMATGQVGTKITLGPTSLTPSATPTAPVRSARPTSTTAKGCRRVRSLPTAASNSHPSYV